ncbi:GTP cyclohydrolase II [Paenibacillus urinalis]|uniref:GTP cyclohydrolase II n=1 Tax=Paenibacillus urinalis TaxID=521520 RepID=A0AAX3N1C5_9BACL|nr:MULTISPECIES: GTP cyclohydrolase II [Paenibacillus]WDH82469.1 GTP cyclohydrolase II [Paenibacillus urinalis]WDH98525.1 GTP cyclohydrolase II [Paenibacillus urinalis]WDI02216.1 GTP cyclohydrolase II [Paenibacillus urinalis]GAK40105.1 GTP cyclohydrolase II [Paenibacillus sp. TCA20]
MITNDTIQILKNKIKTIGGGDGEKHIYLVGPVQLPVNMEDNTLVFKWYSWITSEKQMDEQELIASLANAQLADQQQSSVLVYGDFEHHPDAMIRMHSICHTGDIFGSKRCDCGYQLHESMKMIAAHGAGAVFYLANHEGRGIGLFSKTMAYLLQEEGYDTVDANLALGFADDQRDYSETIRVLRALREEPVRLITNNPRKLASLQKAGMSVSGRVPLWGDRSAYNDKYLKTKVSRSGHLEEHAEWVQDVRLS